jgi:hypothetical protein
MSIETMIDALAEVKAICISHQYCQGCPFELASGCLARAKNLVNEDDYPMNWAVGEKNERT